MQQARISCCTSGLFLVAPGCGLKARLFFVRSVLVALVALFRPLVALLDTMKNLVKYSFLFSTATSAASATRIL